MVAPVEQDAQLAALVRQEVARALPQALKGYRRKTTIVAFSGEMDRMFAALSLASASAACGLETTIFFTFWGLAALRKPKGTGGARKSWLDWLVGRMLPSGCGSLPVSSMNFGGAGAWFFRWLMRSRNVQSVAEMLNDARSLGVRLVACQMSLDVLGLRREELIDGVEIGGAATYLQDASESTVTLFV
jgi:peroxiredoxin family protein